MSDPLRRMTATSTVAEPRSLTPATEACSGVCAAIEAAALAQAACAAAAASSESSSVASGALSSAALAAAARESSGLPALVGTATEVAAAMVIRARALRRLRLDLAERIREEASARWWIDHRHQVVG